MIKLPLSEAYRKHLEWSRGLTTDAAGNEILCGLTTDESAELLALRDQRRINPSARDRRIFLQGKHETARIAVASAEVEARGAGKPN